MNPKDWFTLIFNSKAFCVTGVRCTVSNMIPLTEQTSIQGNATFTTFNNTIYAICYTDHEYETEWEEIIGTNTDNFWHREGLTNGARFMLPTYTHGIWRTDSNPGNHYNVYYGWDPLIHAGELFELRPGKNAVSYDWQATEKHFINTNVMQQFDPTWTPGPLGVATVYSQEMHLVNNSNVTPHGHLNRWIAQTDLNPASLSAWKKSAIQHPGIMEQQWSKPIPNWFIKMIPLFDSANALIKTTANQKKTYLLYLGKI